VGTGQQAQRDDVVGGIAQHRAQIAGRGLHIARQQRDPRAGDQGLAVLGFDREDLGQQRIGARLVLLGKRELDQLVAREQRIRAVAIKLHDLLIHRARIRHPHHRGVELAERKAQFVELRLLFDETLQRGFGQLGVAVVGQELGQPQFQLHVVGAGVDDAAQRRLGLVGAPVLLEITHQAVVIEEIVGVGLDQFAIHRQRFFLAMVLLQHTDLQQLQRGVLRLARKSVTDDRERALGVSISIDRAQHRDRTDVGGLGLQRQLGLGLGRGVVALLVEHAAAQGVRIGIVGLQREYRVGLLQGLIIQRVGIEHLAQLDARRHMLGIEIDHQLQVGEHLLPVLLLLVQLRQQVAARHIVRIDLQDVLRLDHRLVEITGIEVLLRALEVLRLALLATGAGNQRGKAESQKYVEQGTGRSRHKNFRSSHGERSDLFTR